MMLQIHNVHAAIANRPNFTGRVGLAIIAALLLAACGDFSTEKLQDANPSAMLTPERVAELLPPEAEAVVTSYAADLTGAAKAYKAEFGQLPASFADVASVAGARSAAVTAIADGLAEQVPFASRETVEKAANGVVTAAENKILAVMRTQNAPNP
jgi:hypothetical protein